MALMYGRENDERERALRAWLEEEEKKKLLASNPRAVLDGQVGFREANRLTNNRFATDYYTNNQGRSYSYNSEKGKHYDWEKSYLHDLPKSLGKSYNDKYINLTKSMGMNRTEAERFRKFLDAQEKGALTDWGMGKMNERAVQRMNNARNTDNGGEPVPSERGKIDRIFDALSIGGYYSANLVNNLINEKDGWKSFGEAGREAWKQGNPFSDDVNEGMTFSKVMGNAGWNPETKLGKFTRGALGFAGDVLLDPTTYLTFGTGALVKGAGKGVVSTAKLIEKYGDDLSEGAVKLLRKGTMPDELAQKIVTDHHARVNEVLEPEMFQKQVDALKDKFHQINGTNRENVGIGFGTRNSIANPVIRALGFNSKLSKKLADVHYEIPGSAKLLEKASAVTGLDRGYKNIRKAVYGNKVASLFTQKYDLLNLMKEDPSKLYDVVAFASKTTGLFGDKIKQERAIREYAEKHLSGLSPADNEKLLKALQDKTMFTTIRRMTGIESLRENKALKGRMGEKLVKTTQTLNTLEKLDAEIEDLRSQINTERKPELEQRLRDAEDEYRENLAFLDAKEIDDETTFKRILQLKHNEANRIKEQMNNVEDLEEPVPFKFAEGEIPDEPVKQSVPRVKKPEYEQVPELPEGYTKPVYPERPKREQAVVSDENQHVMAQAKPVVQKWADAWDNARAKGKRTPDVEDTIQTVREFSQLIFGTPDKISVSVYPQAINDLAEIFTKGTSEENLIKYAQRYILNNQHRYDWRGREINTYLGEMFGYGQNHKSGFSNWSEYYTDRVNEIKAKGKKMTPQDRNLLAKLESERFERLAVMGQLMRKSPRELKQFFNQRSLDEMYSDKGVNIDLANQFEGSATRNKKDWSGKESITGKESMMDTGEMADESRRRKFTDEDRAMVSEPMLKDLRTGEFDDRTPNTRLSVEQIDEIEAIVLRQIANGKQTSKTERGVISKPGYDQYVSRKKPQLAKGLGYENLGYDQYRYAGRVAVEAENTLKEFFPNTDWADLSPKQREFVVNISRQNYEVGKTGKGKKATKVDPAQLQKKAEETAKMRREVAHQEAVKSVAEKGSKVVFKQPNGIRKEGEIVSVDGTDDTGLKYKVVHKSTGEVFDINPADVVTVNKKKPLVELLDTGYKSQVDEIFNKAIKDWEDQVRSIDEDYARRVDEFDSKHLQKVRGINDRNLEKEMQYEEDKVKASELRKQYKAEYESKMKEREDALNAVLSKHGLSLDDVRKAREGVDPEQEFGIPKDAWNKMSDEERVELYVDLEGYNGGKPMNDVEMAEHLINKTTREQYEEALVNSSKSAEDLKRQYDEINEEVDRLISEHVNSSKSYAEAKETIGKEIEDWRQKTWDEIIELEKEDFRLEQQLGKGDPEAHKKLRDQIQHLNKLLTDNDAYLDYLEMHMPDVLKKWQAEVDKMNKGVNKGNAKKRNMSDHLSKILDDVRTDFMSAGRAEVDAERLKEGQFQANAFDYAPHIPTPEGERLLKDKTFRVDDDGNLVVEKRDKKDRDPRVTQDLGYGETFSPHSYERTFKKIKLNDEWIENPTIEQINDYVRPAIGFDLFDTNVSNLYLKRMMKNSDLMYDEHYMQQMMREFGRDLNPGYTADKDHKIVMNYGQYNRNVRDMAQLQTQFELEKHIAQGKLEGKPMDKIMEEFNMKRGEIMANYMQEGYDKLGLSKDTIKRLGTPLLEVNSEQAKAMDEYFTSTMDYLRKKYEIPLARAEQAKANGVELDDRSRELLEEYNEVLGKIKPLEIKQVHKTITNKANQARQLKIARDQSKLLRTFDKFQHWMKLSQTAMLPSFHARNILGNMFQSYMAVGNDIYNSDLHKGVFKAIGTRDNLSELKKLGSVKDKNGNELPWSDLMHEARTHRIVDENAFANKINVDDIESEGLFKGLQNVPIGKGKTVSLDPTDVKNFAPIKAGTKFGTRSDSHARFLQYVSHRKNGMSPEKAKEMVDKYLFDYSDLTAFEKSVMTRAMPYYTWLRKNMRLQLSQLIENPGAYRDVAKVQHAIESEVDEEDQVKEQYLPDFAKDWWQLPFMGGKDDNKPILMNPALPYMDLGKIVNPLDPKGALDTIIPQLTVPAKGAIEMATNRNFFFGDHIADDEDSAEKKVVKHLDNIAQSYSPYTIIRDAFKKQGGDKARHIGNALTGVKTLAYDYQMGKDIAVQKYLGKYKDKNKPNWYDKASDKISGEKVKGYTVGALTRMTDDFINGQEITKESAGVFYPFAKIMQSVGADNAKNRAWLGATLNSTKLDKYLTGSDFTSGKVTNVRDGDTIEVEVNGKTIPVRFNLIDTPEIDHGFGAMAYGDDAKKVTEEMLRGKDVQLVMSKHKDAHGRNIAYVYVDGEDVTKRLLEQGLGKVRYSSASDNPYRLEQYQGAQQGAYDSGSGLWQIPGYADPNTEDDYKKKKSSYKKYLDLMGE